MSACPAASPHVTYMVDPEKLEALAGTDWPFLLSPLFDPLYLTLILGTALAALALFAAGEWYAPLRTSCRKLHDRLLGYREFLPLILRVALGIALIVAGTKGAIFLPNVPGPALGMIQIVVGYCLLAGFMVRASGLAALAIFGVGLFQSHYLWGALESGAAALLVAAHGGSRPSVDDLLGIDVLGGVLEPVWRPIRASVGPIVRLALGFTLIWLAITEKALNPRVSEAVVIDFGLESVIPVSSAMWVFTVGVLELAVGLMLVLGLFTRTWSVVAFLILTSSFFYFREEVAGHVTLFGTLLALMVTGAGSWSLDSLAARRTRAVAGTNEPYFEGGSSPEIA